MPLLFSDKLGRLKDKLLAKLFWFKYMIFYTLFGLSNELFDRLTFY